MKKELTNSDIIQTLDFEVILKNPLIGIDEYKQPVVVSSRARVMAKEHFNKVYYFVYNGTLRECKILENVVFPMSNIVPKNNNRSIYSAYLFKVAGLGEVWVNEDSSTGSVPFALYESVDDFKKENHISINTIPVELANVFRGICTLEYGGCGGVKRLVRWYWNGTSAESKSMKENIPYFFFNDASGISLHPDVWLEEVNFSGYPSKELCEKDNEITIVRFEDENEPKENKKKVITFTATLTIEQVEKVEKFITKIS